MTYRRLITTTVAAALAIPAFALSASPAAAAGGEIRITEYMYKGGSGEFVELTNVGDAPVDMTGWSYDDESANPGVFDLSGLGTVEPGESVIFTETDPGTFRADWSLGPEIAVVGPYTNNIGRGDTINVFDAGDNLADTLSYGDEAFPGTIRTDERSGWVTVAGLGADDAAEWVLSSVDDAEDSIQASSGAIGSPGRSTHGSQSDPDSGDLSVEVVVPEVVEPGEFVWSIDGDPDVAMSEAENMGAYLQSTGELTPVVVTDTRDGGPEWSLSGQVSDFTGGVSGSYLGWTPEVISDGAGATAGDPVMSGFDSGNGLTDPATLASADAGHDSGTGTVGADLDLRLPVDTPAGTYTATLTITALS